MQDIPSFQLKKRKIQGQGMVEFAIVLPVVLTIVFGIIEIGFLLFTYSSVNSAAREAARYGIAIGEVGADQRYYDCDGIEEAGLRIGRYAGMTASDISISYDHGPKADGSNPDLAYASCSDLEAAAGGNITFGDRIVVDVNHQYRPLVAYMGLNINPFTMSATSARTIFKGAEIIEGGGDGGGGGGGGETCFILNLYAVGGTAVAPTASQATNCTTDGGADGYTDGTTINLTAYPQTDWHVSNWSGATPDADPTYATLNITADTTVTVTYSPDSDTCYALNVSYDGNGSNPTYTPGNSDVCDPGSFVDGEIITLTGQPAAGWGTDSWTGAVKIDYETARRLMPAFDLNVTAHYVECYTVSTSVDPATPWGGTPTVVTNSASCAVGYAEGETVTVQAYPDSGYQVAGWTGVDSSSGEQATLTVPAGGASVVVSYEEEPIFPPPVNLVVPNNYPGDFKYNEGGIGSCSEVKFDFAENSAWPRLPDYYNVYVMIDSASGTSTSTYKVVATQWTAGATVDKGYDISFGVEAVFVNNPSAVSMYAEVTYRCLFKSLEYRGSLTRGQ